jgi:hypothetical protein
VRGQTRSNEKERAAIRQRRADRAAQSKLNRAQLRAMEVRAAETLAPEPDALVAMDAVSAGSAATATAQPRHAASMTRRVIARPIVLTKEQEYRFIRIDLHRLGITAGLLFVMMIALLFVVES